MKEIIKTIAETFGNIIGVLFRPFPIKLAQAFGVHIYTGYHVRRFKHWGKNSILGYPMERSNRLDLISVGDHCEIDKHVVLTVYPQPNTQPEIRIGNGCHIGAHAHLTAIRGIIIGDNLLTGTNVIITDNAHGATNNFKETNIRVKGHGHNRQQRVAGKQRMCASWGTNRRWRSRSSQQLRHPRLTRLLHSSRLSSQNH